MRRFTVYSICFMPGIRLISRNHQYQEMGLFFNIKYVIFWYRKIDFVIHISRNLISDKNDILTSRNIFGERNLKSGKTELLSNEACL